ncbi:telomerase reverse transcriptase isoform X2 [Paroedura picta]|uniref:telomerase reverse transcriptase isoform X2 n=1 Tax=Paroedura picta TaxID=143630 RepID=UPI0040565EBF
MEALRGCFAAVEPLGAWLERVRAGAEGPPLEQEGDPPALRQLQRRCLVGIPPHAPPAPPPAAAPQVWSPREVVERVAARGWGWAGGARLGAGPWAAEALGGSVLWEALLGRVGDAALLAHLLERAALLVRVPPACCLQLAGPPARPARRPPGPPRQPPDAKRRRTSSGAPEHDRQREAAAGPRSPDWSFEGAPQEEAEEEEGASGGGLRARALLYSGRPWRERLAPGFVLNGPAAGLLAAVFGAEAAERVPGRGGGRRRRGRGRRWRAAGAALEELRARHLRCPYGALLRRHCPAGGSGAASAGGWLVRRSSSAGQVYGFLRACLERVVPAALWGSRHNKRRFYKNVRKLLALRKADALPARELLRKMRVKDCAWLAAAPERGCSVPAAEHHFRTRLLSQFLFWLMDTYVIQLLRSSFYITETGFQKNLLLFYRKAVWSQLQSLAVKSHLADVQLRALSQEEIAALQQRRYIPVAGKLRFIPKMNGLRPVVRLNTLLGAEKFSRKDRGKKVQYFKMQLKKLYSVLKYEQKKNPSLLGSSVFGKDDIYSTWKKFVLGVLESNAEMPPFYFVKADVSRAYDSIPTQKVVDVIAQILGPGNKTSYCIRCYAVILRAKNGQIIKRYRRHVSTPEEFIPDMAEFLHHLQQTTSLRNALVIEQSVDLKERCSDLFEFFLQLIHNNILKIENRYYVQCCGIPQGSILSTLLCNLCYGDMENKLLHGVQKDGVLMRLTDDFLLVTPHLAEAKKFLRTLAASIPEYGFSINPAKTVVNFPLDEAADIPGYSAFQQLPAHSMFPWCGLLIDTQTLEVYSDYSSYARTSVRASLSFRRDSPAGVHMRNKLLGVLQLQCHHLLLDLQINSLKTVYINIYKIFLLQAYRFHACVLQLPLKQQIENNPRFLWRIIADTASCSFSLLKAKNAGVSFPAAGPSALPPLEAVQWLCYEAFSAKLAQHRVLYKGLLMPLKQAPLRRFLHPIESPLDPHRGDGQPQGKMRLLQEIPEATMQLLQKVTEPQLCEDFNVILD